MKVVILGGGFGGIYVATGLRKLFSPKQMDILVIDKTTCFEFFPAFHKVISQKDSKEDVCIDLETNLAREYINYLHDEIISLDPDEKTIKTGNHEIKYDILVISMGAVDNFFNIEGAERNTLTLKKLENVEKINKGIKHEIRRKKKVEVVVCGGGLTGVESVFEVKDLIDEMSEVYDLIEKNKISIVEAAKNVLPFANGTAQKLAKRALQESNIEIKLNNPIEKIIKNEVILKNNEKISADIIIWTGGVKPAPVLKNFNLELSEKGAIFVNEHLQIKKYPDIFALGDNIFYLDSKQKPVLQTAQNAELQSKIILKNIKRYIKNKPLKKYKPKSKFIVLASLGKKTCLLIYGNITFSLKIFNNLKKLLRKKINKRIKNE